MSCACFACRSGRPPCHSMYNARPTLLFRLHSPPQTSSDVVKACAKETAHGNAQRGGWREEHLFGLGSRFVLLTSLSCSSLPLRATLAKRICGLPRLRTCRKPCDRISSGANGPCKHMVSLPHPAPPCKLYFRGFRITFLSFPFIFLYLPSRLTASLPRRGWKKER